MVKMTGAQAAADAQRIEMERDPELFLMGIDIRHLGGAMGQNVGLYNEFGGDRVFDMPISESGYTGMAVGLALSGVPTIVEIQFADFATYAFDAIVNQAAKIRYLNDGQVNLPLVIRSTQGGGMYFGAQHSQVVESWFANVPGLKVLVPESPADMKGLLASAIRDPDPVLYLDHKTCVFMKGEVPEGEYLVPIGKGNILKEGKDVTIISWQKGLHMVGSAMEELAKAGIDVELIDLRTLVPFDKDLISASVGKTGRALIVHESPLRGGFGGEIAAFIADACYGSLKAPVKRLASANIPIPFGGVDAFLYPDAQDILRTVTEMVNA